MKTQIHFLLLAALMLAVTVSPLRAQPVADGATNTLSNVTNTFTGDVTVGTNDSFTLLVLSDNALLTNLANGFEGWRRARGCLKTRYSEGRVTRVPDCSAILKDWGLV